MLLFINVFITNQRHPTAKVLRDDRFDVFKYQLASLGAIPWDKAVIYCLLDKEYQARQAELEAWLEVLNCPVEFHPYRNLKQEEWQKACEGILGQSKDGLIWLLSNDDHLFIDKNLSVLNEGLELLKREPGRASLYFSHWPENMRWFAGRRAQRVGDYVFADRIMTDGIQIVNEALLKTWFFDLDLHGLDLRRSDDVMAASRGEYANYPFRCFLPLKEIGYHMEGYMHVDIPYSLCPIWSIPRGFFEKEIKIAYCPEARRDGWVHLDPRKPFPETDYRWLMEDIPMFWRNRIAEFSNTHPDQAELKQARINYLKDMVGYKPNSEWARESDATPPDNWLVV